MIAVVAKRAAAAAPTCPYCGQAAELLTDSSPIYHGHNYGPVWICRTDDAWVGCHKGSMRPLGRLANAYLRQAKMAAHRAFDPLWKDLRGAYPDLKYATAKHRGIARSRAYQWLAEALGIPREDCHIGMFDVALCEATVRVITERGPTAAAIRGWWKERDCTGTGASNQAKPTRNSALVNF